MINRCTTVNSMILTCYIHHMYKATYSLIKYESWANDNVDIIPQQSPTCKVLEENNKNPRIYRLINIKLHTLCPLTHLNEVQCYMLDTESFCSTRIMTLRITQYYVIEDLDIMHVVSKKDCILFFSGSLWKS